MEKEFYTPPEEKLFREFLSWVESTKKLYREFEQEGIPVPSTLKRVLLDTNQGSARKTARRNLLRKPDAPEKPARAGDEWLWIEVKDASLRSIVLAILNEGKVIPVKEVINRVKEVLPESNEGSIYNMAAQEEKIQKTDQGWKLKDNAEAPVLYKNFIWGSPNLLQKPDLAAFRRMSVRDLLETSSDGLQIMQVYRQLEGADWLKEIPLSKDLVKADLFIMKKEKQAKQIGNTKKWTIIKNPE